MAPPFPESPVFAGYEAPCRFEGEVFELIVHGEIPPQIDGTFYRVMPDPAFYNFKVNDINFNGDGNISAFRIRNGHVDFKQKYVHTERLVRERVARRTLFGLYRNRYTNDPSVTWANQSTANTNIVYYNHQLLALKEDSPPYALDPDTLETKGVYDFDGQLTGLTFTAHPKVDPLTGDFIAMGYEAKGDATKDVVYYCFDKNGRKTQECWVEAPWSGMIHDMGVTANYVIFQLQPLVADLERMKQGGLHFQWDDDRPAVLGLLPRRNAKPEDVRWYNFPNAFLGHVANAFERDGIVYLDSAYTLGNVFTFFPNKHGESPDPRTLKSSIVRFALDPKLPSGSWPTYPTTVSTVHGEFPRVDDRFVAKEYRYIWLGIMDNTKGRDDYILGGIFNSLGQIDVTTGEVQAWFAGTSSGIQEPVFIPRSKDAPEGDGFIMALVNRHATMLSDLVILDTKKLAEGPIATINLPLRLRTGLHGNWVDASEFAEDKPLVGF